MAKSATKEHTWDDAIQKVLATADRALHYAEIAEQIASQGLRTKLGANPAATVASTISKSLQDEASPFQRTGRGEYALKHDPRAHAPDIADVAQQEDISETGALRAFGMFWQRGLIAWTGTAKLLGRQQAGASDVNFTDQVGVYLLHDRDRVIYVGRASDTLFARLKAHTSDRLSGRWDRFSWFGLRSVDDDGNLLEPSVSWTHEVVIETLEALLIECMEPPLNRRRGDNFSAVEYLQVADPGLEKQRKKQLLAELARGVE